MWGVERDPRAPLGRRGAQRGGLVDVFGGSSVVAVEPPRVAVGVPGGEERCCTVLFMITGILMSMSISNKKVEYSY